MPDVVTATTLGYNIGEQFECSQGIDVPRTVTSTVLPALIVSLCVTCSDSSDEGRPSGPDHLPTQDSGGIAFDVEAVDDGQPVDADSGTEPRDCRFAADQCAAGFRCVEQDGTWTCVPFADLDASADSDSVDDEVAADGSTDPPIDVTDAEEPTDATVDDSDTREPTDADVDASDAADPATEASLDVGDTGFDDAPDIDLSGDRGILVVLTWETPGDPDPHDHGGGRGSDVDLHLLHPNGSWDVAPWDCFWRNRHPDWGDSAISDDDPYLTIDDTDGAGPEIIVLLEPEGTLESPVSYRVGVFYYSDHNYGESHATVALTIDGVPHEPIVRENIEDRQFWEVATVSWPSGEVLVVDRLFPSGFP